MDRKLLVSLMAAMAVILSSRPCQGTEINIDRFPKAVSAGQNADLVVTWKEFSGEKEYILRVQLQDGEANPPIFVFQDLEITKPEGQLEITLPIPLTVTASESAKFVAAFISRTKVWDDVLISTDTGNVITILSDFKFTIDEYPRLVWKGETAQLKISWKGVKASRDYKLIVQLENWQIKPGFAYVVRIDDFGTEGERTVNIKVPDFSPEVKNCRFVAAFISKVKNWEDLFAITSTPYDVEIVKYKPL